MGRVFSDDAADRNALVPIARSRAETYDIPVEAIERVIVIGDTPHDIECARVAGARSIAVATGGFTVDQLREAGADEVLPDLSDTEARSGVVDMMHWKSNRGAPVAARRSSKSACQPARKASWRKRLGVEPSLPRKEAATDFEDREGQAGQSVVDVNLPLAFGSTSQSATPIQ